MFYAKRTPKQRKFLSQFSKLSPPLTPLTATSPQEKLFLALVERVTALEKCLIDDDDDSSDEEDQPASQYDLDESDLLEEKEDLSDERRVFGKVARKRVSLAKPSSNSDTPSTTTSLSPRAMESTPTSTSEATTSLIQRLPLADVNQPPSINGSASTKTPSFSVPRSRSPLHRIPPFTGPRTPSSSRPMYQPRYHQGQGSGHPTYRGFRFAPYLSDKPQIGTTPSASSSKPGPSTPVTP